MRIYQGKLNTKTGTAENEVITFSFAWGIEEDTNAVATGQWTKNHAGDDYVNYSLKGTITNVENGKIEIFAGEDQYYWFEGTVDAARENITLDMKSPNLPDYGKAELKLVFEDEADDEEEERKKAEEEEKARKHAKKMKDRTFTIDDVPLKDME